MNILIKCIDFMNIMSYLAHKILKMGSLQEKKSPAENLKLTVLTIYLSKLPENTIIVVISVFCQFLSVLFWHF